MTTRERGKLAFVLVAGAVLLAWLLLTHGSRPSAPAALRAVAPLVRPTPPTPPAPPAPPTPPPALPAAEPVVAKAAVPDDEPPPQVAKQEPTTGRFTLTGEDERARQRTWVQATWGSGDDQLGADYLAGGGDLYSPQGFTITREGKLIVLDSNNTRVVQYDRSGRIERRISVAPLVMPADVALAADGTLIVADHPGVQTGGLLLIKPDGSKRELPAVQDGFMAGLYTVGNDFYFDVAGLDGHYSVRGGDSSGDLSDETPGVYNYEGDNIVPGLIAPDGKTVISIGVESREALGRGEFYVSAIRGEPPEHLFTHELVWPHALGGVLWAAADERGRVYAVVQDGPSRSDVLVCLDAQGQPVGTATMGHTDLDKAQPLRLYNLDPSGGLVVMHMSPQDVKYDWYDCH